MMSATPALRILGSGSSGNLAILDLPDPTPDGGPPRHLLIDLGLGPRTTRTRLNEHGGDLALDRVIGVLATHADQDHLRPSWAHMRAHMAHTNLQVGGKIRMCISKESF